MAEKERGGFHHTSRFLERERGNEGHKNLEKKLFADKPINMGGRT